MLILPEASFKRREKKKISPNYNVNYQESKVNK